MVIGVRIVVEVILKRSMRELSGIMEMLIWGGWSHRCTYVKKITKLNICAFYYK